MGEVMVGHDSGYGIILTDEFGSPFYEDLVEAIKALKNSGRSFYPKWVLDFPSAEDDQLILGMRVGVHKKMNFAEIHAQWEELMKTVPKEIQDIMNEYDLPEPDMHIVSGKY
jgi:hypothetical protein